MTIDVEDYFQVGVFQDRVRQEEWGNFELRVGRNLDRCCEILDEFDIKATFFVLGWVAEQIPDAIKRLAAEGHEVGSHGYNHQPIWKLDPESFQEDIAKSQGILGDILGQAPTCYRAPCFSVTTKTLWALDILHDAGFTHDSSIFPVHHPEYGIPDAPEGLHRIKLPSGGEIVEFPMTVGSLLGKKLAFCGGGWFRLFPYRLTRRSLKRSEATRPFVFYLHPWELDPDQPRLHDRTSRLGRFRHYVNLDRNEDKFRRLLAEFNFGTMKDVFDAAMQSQGELPLVDYWVSK
ncbi:MAG: polysaccharide deacetylase family protein (PEP-CTERM system associated) [Planctomycetota bacterium]|jgi:polysaccharide deacetylase family protein (PEP-CTERM system associated)